MDNFFLWTTLGKKLWITKQLVDNRVPVDEVVQNLWKSAMIKKTGRLWKTCRAVENSVTGYLVDDALKYRLSTTSETIERPPT